MKTIFKGPLVFLLCISLTACAAVNILQQDNNKSIYSISESEKSTNTDSLDPGVSLSRAGNSTPTESTETVSTATEIEETQASVPFSQETERLTETTPSSIQLPETEPEATEHQHSYSAYVVTPTCVESGYTYYSCSCGSSYIACEIVATGHSFGEWITTVAATTETEGQQTRTCGNCGGKETKVISMIQVEAIDTAALETYGRSYAVNTYGYQIDTGMNRETYCGYYPGYARYMPTMDAAFGEVIACVDDTTNALIACYGAVVKEIDGFSIGIRLNIEVEHNEGPVYTVWVYYG